jgi:hypothetical protein
MIFKSKTVVVDANLQPTTALLLVGLISLLLSGCCWMNNYVDQHAAYEKYMDSLVGHNSNERGGEILRLEEYKRRLGRVYEIVDYNGEPVYQRIKQELQWGKLCDAEDLVSVNTGRVVAWRYVPGSDPQKCTRTPYSCRY